MSLFWCKHETLQINVFNDVKINPIYFISNFMIFFHLNFISYSNVSTTKGLYYTEILVFKFTNSKNSQNNVIYMHVLS